MNLIQKEIKVNEAKIEELKSELEEWENYNKCENDLMKDDINSIIKLNKILKQNVK